MTLRNDARAIWNAGVSAVNSAQLVQQVVRVDHDQILISCESFPVESLRRIIVLGAGKAGAGMASGLESALGTELVKSKVHGWVNVPSDCVRPLQRIHLHGARPAGVNEPTAEGVVGSTRILELAASLEDQDLCIVLISGGGSALLPAPADGISLAEKLDVTRCLMQSGATIRELNTVRKQLSRIKGGGLLRSAKAGHFVALIISDVPGDPLDMIASGPTVPDSGSPREALEVLERIVGRSDPKKQIPGTVWRFLEAKSVADQTSTKPLVACHNLIIGNNQTAVDAAAEMARMLEYEVRVLGSDREGIARNMGRALAELALAARDERRNHGICFVAGGEPIVRLVSTENRGRGGRNQELALAAGCRLIGEEIGRLVVLSGGTDGEDGPTDAAGAIFDQAIQKSALHYGVDPEEFLQRNDSYTFFDQFDGLLKTGPTHTNVMDLQIALIDGVAQ